jgi:hypothetical protein
VTITEQAVEPVQPREIVGGFEYEINFAIASGAGTARVVFSECGR